MMARRYHCKCQVTGEEGFTDEFYRVKTGSRNLYYKDKETYIEHMKDKVDRNKLLNILAVSVMDYSSPAMLSRGLLAQIKALNKTYSYKVMVMTVEQHMDLLKYYGGLAGKFKTENHRQMYIFAIIKDKILDVHLAYEQKLKMQKKALQREESVAEVDLLNMGQDKVNTHSQKRVNITDFL